MLPTIRTEYRVSAWAVPRGNGRWQLIRGEHFMGRYTEQLIGRPVTEEAALRILRWKADR